MIGVYAVVKRYERNGVEHAAWYYRSNEHDRIYEKVMELTGNDHEIAAEAASWCESATVGEVREFREGEIEISDMG